MTAPATSNMRDGETAIPITDAVRRIADAYPPGASDTPRWVRERFFTDDQRAAWTLRFDPPPVVEVTL